jgi:predicted metal-binding membrane protein
MASIVVWRRSRIVTGGILLLVATASWAMVFAQPPGGMPMNEMEGAGLAISATALLAFLASWGVMMAAMMLPSAIPMISLYAGLNTPGRGAGSPVALFTLIYVVLWLAVGLPAYVIGLLFQTRPDAGMLAPYGIAAVLLAAGIYQFSPLKRTCLRVCRSPLGFLMGHWRAGYAGTLTLALKHAGYCLGCCWALMIVLVAAGGMGLQWVALLAIVIFAEKILPGGEWFARLAGAGLVLLAILIVLQPGLAGVLRGQSM